jgi:large subunit ribosomal protein L6
MPIPVPSGVKITQKDNNVTVEGTKGKLSRDLPPDITVVQEGEMILVSRPTDQREHRSLHGLTRTLLANMVEGVSKGFEKMLEIYGVGYRAQKTDKGITLQIGFCHPVEIESPEGIELLVRATTRIKVVGINKELVGETAARIRRIRPAETYKGKGIRYQGERVRIKPGKAGKTAMRK